MDGGLTMSDLVQQILAKTVEEGDCLIWQGRIANGSPLVYVDGVYRTARRVLWEALHGPMKPGMNATCSCREPGCVKPEHLRAASVKQIAKQAGKEGKFSSLQRRAKIAAACRKRSQLTPEMVQRIRLADSGAAIARELGICRSTASKIRRGDSWRTIGASVFGL